MTSSQMRRRALLAFVLNRPGVLNKISMLIRRKMYNVETLTVCKSIRPGISRMTLTLREDSDAKVLQVIKQIEKITAVVSVKGLDTDQSFWREVAIVKVETDEDHLNQLPEKYKYEILDRQNHGLYIIQVAGTSQYIDDFVAALGRENLIEVARSGFTAVEK